MNLRRIVGALAATAVATGATLLLAPTAAHAATTVSTQLAFSGVVTTKSPAGGKVVGIHPGDTVDLKAATVPTAGLDALGLGGLANSLLGSLTGYQVVVHIPANFPGGKRDVKLGACGGASHLPLTFPAKGTYDFTWNAYQISPLCLAPASLSTSDLNQLKAAGVAINAQQQWVGQVVVADNPPAGGIGVQVPGVAASPSLPVVGQLPSVGLPGATTPTLPNILDPGLTGQPGGTKNPPSGNPNPAASGPAFNYHSNGPSVADRTVPHGYGGGSGAASNYVPAGLSGSIVAPGTNFAANGKAPGASTPAAGPAGSAPKTVDVASSKSRSALDALPTLLVVLAVIALSGATACYARTFLLHKPEAPVKLA